MSIYSDLSELIISIEPIEQPDPIYINEHRFSQLKTGPTNYGQISYPPFIGMPIMTDNDLKDNEYKQNGKIHKF